jgi:hypothetical protein
MASALRTTSLPGVGRHRNDRDGRVGARLLLDLQRRFDRVFVEGIEHGFDAGAHEALRRRIDALVGARIRDEFDGDDDFHGRGMASGAVQGKPSPLAHEAPTSL